MATANLVFISLLVFCSAATLWWGARTLPGEKWQILAAVPCSKCGDGSWTGRNLTYYGVIVAGAYTLSACLFLLLMSAIGMTLPVILTKVGLVLAVCAPASKIIARVVEKKKHTFTVGGAAFAGMIVAPWIFYAVLTGVGRPSNPAATVIVSMAALTIAYAFGEGLGRMACVSFGCCYGKRVEDLPPVWRKIFRKFNFIFTGRTKKIAYAHGWEGQAVVPVQLITSILYVSTGLAGLVFFLNGMAGTAFLVPLVVTQVWRVVSEFLRADFRGQASRLTTYQIMALATIPCGMVVVWFFGPPAVFEPDISNGLKSLWRPGVLIFLQLLWAIIFMQTGRSMVTGSRMTVFIHQDKI